MTEENELIDTQTFTLSSPDIAEYANISEAQYLNSFGCSGQNERPNLTWSNAPKGTKSYALTLYDQDAPTGSGFWHWVLFDVPTTLSGIAAGPKPAGSMEANTDFGEPGYFGPCPPVGRKHRYTFYVHALDVEKLEVPENATGALAGFYIHQHTLAKASFTVIAGPREADT